MKTKKFLFSCLIILFSIVTINAQENNLYSTTVEKSGRLNIEPDFGLSIGNMNGDIQVEYWDKQYVEYKAQISAQGWEEEAVNDFTNIIAPIIKIDSGKCKRVKITMDYKHFKRKCDCENGDEHIYRKWFKKIKVKDYNIHYKIFIPRQLSSLYIYNYYGNIVIPEFTGKLHIQLTEGLLQSDSLILSEESFLRIKNSATNIKYLQAYASNISFMYCDDIRINRLECSFLKTKKSNLRLGSFSCKNYNSLTDSIIIDEAMQIKMKASFSNLKIKHAVGPLNLDFQQSGNISIDSYTKDFNSLIFKGLYSNTNLSINNKDFILELALKNSYLDGSSFGKETNNLNPIDMERVLGNPKSGRKIIIDCENCDIKL